MGFKFIHAADIHLDSPLRGLSAYENAPAEQLRNASREALKELVTRAIDDKVAFVIFAGDLYDGDWRDYNTGIFFIAQMGRLARAGIRAFVLNGNHDAESEMTRKLVLPDNVSVFSSRSAQVIKLDEFKVALHGQSFANRSVTDNLAAGYKPRVDGYFNIGVLHTALEGYAAHASYAPCTLAELYAKGYDYWALGHVHEFQQWDGPSIVVFPGNLQGRHARETGRKGAVTVSVDDAGRASVERLFLDILRWEAVSVDVSELHDMDDVARAVGRSLGQLIASDAVPRAVRVQLIGSSALHGLLMGNSSHLRAQVIAQAAAVDAERLWIEKLKIQTTPIAQSAASAEASNEALADLQSIFEQAGDDPAFLAQLQEQLRPFLNKVSDEIKDEVPLLDAARNQRLGELVQQVGPALLAQLATKGA